MFDWDDVPEELGGPNRSAPEVDLRAEEHTLEDEVESEEEDDGGGGDGESAPQGLASLLCLDENYKGRERKQKPKQKPRTRPSTTTAAGEDRAALRSLRIGELRRRLAESGIKAPPHAVEKDDLVSLLLGSAAGAPAAEPGRPVHHEPRPAAQEAYRGPEPAAQQVNTGGADGGGKEAFRSPHKKAPAKRLERMAAEVDSQGVRAGETQLQSSLKQQFQRMKEQRRKEEAKREAQRRGEAERQEEPCKVQDGPPSDGPGPYLITKKTLATVRADRGGGKVDELLPGQIIEVLEVLECEGRTRARIADPPCWFSIVNNDTGTRFAEKEKAEQQRPITAGVARKAPSKFAAFSRVAASHKQAGDDDVEPWAEEPPLEPEAPPAKPSPLAVAARSGSLRKVMQVLQQGVNVNAGDARGETPLSAAAASGSIDVTAALLLHSADPSRKSKSGRIAQDSAPPGPVRGLLELAQGNFEAASMQSILGVLDPLLRPQVTHMLQDKMQAKMRKQESQRGGGGPAPGGAPGAPARAPAAATATARPVEEEPRPSPKALAAEPAKAGSVSALTKACKAGSLKEVMRLLQDGADPNAADVVGETPLFEAAAHGFADVTAALLVYRGDPERKSGTGLLAGDLTTDGTVRCLLAFFGGEDMTSEQLEFLLEGLGETMREIIGRMVHSLEASKRGLADGEVGEAVPAVPPRDRIIDTAHLSEAPLARAAREGDVEEVRRLLEERADPNSTDDLGETPLFEAVASGFSDVTALLLLSGADPQRRSDAGGAAADIAADMPSKLLLDFFKGLEISNDDKYAVVYEAIRDTEVREAIAVKFRTRNMQEAYKHTLRKLRA